MSTPDPTPRPGSGAKPLRADAARNRQKILDAARAAFAEDGAQAQIDDVARRAGVGVGTVYRHFPTKESLAQAIVEQRFDLIIDFVRDDVLTDPDPWHALERSFEFCAETQRGDRGYADAVAAVAGPGEMSPLGPLAEQKRELLRLSEQMVARARVAGVVRPDLRGDDLAPMFAGLAAVVQAGVADWRRYVELLMDGLRPRPGG